MAQRGKINRPITPEEIAVIRAALERAAVSSDIPMSRPELQHLRVVGHCSCGCDSVDFADHDAADPAKPIADGVGTTPAGGTVGVIIWGRAGSVTSIEVYDLGAGDADVRLPVPGTIRRWSGTA